MRVGDIVRYVQTNDSASGYKSEEINKYRRDKYKKFIGNLGVIKKVSIAHGGWPESYSISPIDPMPYVAWFDDTEVELVDSLEDRLKLIKVEG